MTATIRNTGMQDTAVIFGIVLGNGSKYMVLGMTLEVTTDGSGPAEHHQYHPRHYPSGIAGRVDDWIVPLPVGGAYALTLEAADFIAGNERKDSLPRDARISLRLPIRGPAGEPNPDVAGLRHFRVWTGSTALVSNELATSESCR
jgi:hypothetical protein